MSNTSTRDKYLADLARRILNIQTLEVRNRDRLDFHEVGVWALRQALEMAYEAGHTKGYCVGINDGMGNEHK